ncbi:MAG: energy transducer TonB [Methylovulum sp.]|nr:energy transducer TonB [Methylovulum sp.]
MSKHNLKVLDFPVSAAQKSVLVDNRASGSAMLTVVNGKNASAALIGLNHPGSQAIKNQSNLFGRGEYLTGISVTLAVHLFWLFLMPAAETHELINPPEPIMVQWLSSPQPHSEHAKTLPPPQPPKKQVRPMIKPKLNPVKVAAKPSTRLVAASHKTAEVISASAMTEQPKPAAVAESQAVPIVTTEAKLSAAEPMPVTLPHLNADYLDNPAPQYPAASRELGEQGRVQVRAMVTADGRVGQVVLRKSSGFSRLDQAALESVKHWRFVPAQQGGQHVSAWVVVPVAFSIEG